ncbi:hypothetical protein FRC20_010595 [Serendipita sp. 405]|nr:hypothetical protein FRC20_010595 [Serendipita sp. 405]
MISLLAFYTLASRESKAEDVANCPTYSTVADSYRSLPNIIWSCLTTILLCTWVSLHPNVPKPVDETKLSKRERYAHKLRTFLKDQALPFVLLLVAPEWVLMWALRQRLVVEYLVRNKQAPTRRHGFFIIMGGFHKFSKVEVLAPSDPATSDPATSDPATSDPVPSDPLIGSDVEKMPTDKKSEDEHGEPNHPLDRFDVCRLVDDGRLQLPLEVEIDDKSKSDWIAKSLVLLQTLWFVVQCGARKMDHLPLTELEVVTLGYALLNFFVYVIWWDKPQKVARPIRVFCGELPERNEEQWEFMWSMEEDDWFEKLFYPLVGMQDNFADLRSLKQTPTFYSGNPPEKKWPIESMPLELFALVVTSVIGGVFGAIHLIAWSSPFPTHKMLVLWRWGSILMAAAPIPTLFFCITLLFWEFLEGVDNNFLKAIQYLIIIPLVVLSIILTFLIVPLVYVAGRVITLTIAFQTLSSLPPESFQSVQWTNLFPHI